MIEGNAAVIRNRVLSRVETFFNWRLQFIVQTKELRLSGDIQSIWNCWACKLHMHFFSIMSVKMLHNVIATTLEHCVTHYTCWLFPRPHLFCQTVPLGLWQKPLIPYYYPYYQVKSINRIFIHIDSGSRICQLLGKKLKCVAGLSGSPICDKIK